MAGMARGGVESVFRDAAGRLGCMNIFCGMLLSLLLVHLWERGWAWVLPYVCMMWFGWRDKKQRTDERSEPVCFSDELLHRDML